MSSKIDINKMPFSAPKSPYGEGGGLLDVGDGHKLYIQEFGNPKGEPVVVLHGGPGGGCDTIYAQYFDPKRYRIIMFDQRGCGFSQPTMKTDLKAAMHENNTAKLVGDIEKIRDHLGIQSKMHVFGGSWGSTLSLAYAMKHPEHVQSLILRGIFLGKRAGTDYLFQGNAATYDDSMAPPSDPLDADAMAKFMQHYASQDHSKEGGYRAFLGDGKLPGQIPAQYHASHKHMAEGYARAWHEFVNVIPKEKRGDMIAAYCEVLEMDPRNEEERAYQQRAAFAFAKWEGMTSNFNLDVGDNGVIDLKKFEDPDFALIFARMEARYMQDGLYLNDEGKPTKDPETYLLDGLKKIAPHKIPMFIVHGANDQVCPVREAYELQGAYVDLGGHAKLVTPSESGHSMIEEGNARALAKIMKDMPKMSKAKLQSGQRKGADHIGEDDDIQIA